MPKKAAFGILIILAAGVAWYLLSPLWRVKELHEAAPEAAGVMKSAPFVASAHEVTGEARLIQEGPAKTLRFENFETVNGPDLRIYLAADLDAKEFVDLGPIRATKGSANYELPSSLDTNKYNKVLVWCRAFRVLFSYAEL